MKWFKHNTDAHGNLKTQSVIAELGVAAYGFWWICVELVANQGTNSQIQADKKWLQGLVMRSGCPMEQIKEWLDFFAKENLIDGESLAAGILHIPSLPEYGDEYSSRKKEPKRVSGEYRDNVVLDKNRIDKNKEDGDDSPLTPIFEKKIREKDEEYRNLVKELAAEDYISGTNINEIVLNEFLPHWLERSEGAKKARWEKERAFEYQKRIRTWIGNHHKYAKDWKCRDKLWHRKGETCHCKPPEIRQTGPLMPNQSAAIKALALSKRVPTNE